MKKISTVLCGVSLCLGLPLVAEAAGTYYTGSYQSVQQPYSAQRMNSYSSYSNRSPSYSAYSSNTGTRYYAPGVNSYSQPVQQRTTASSSTKDSGFYINAGVNKETASWNFDMKESGSILNYSDVDWMVFDVNAGYKFGLGKGAMVVDAGFKYGIQTGETSMVDDDITNGGFFVTRWCEALGENGECVGFIGDQIGHALSIGTSKGGSMMGFNVGLGLSDMLKVGNIKITPSIGYRHFGYHLQTEKNYGLAVETSACFQIDGSDEIQCDPAIVINYADGTQQIIWRDEMTGNMEIGTGATTVNPGGTYYYQQPGVSHSYDVSWSGPYVAMDLDYEINQNNAVNGRVELGLPGYHAEGDQPYRFDWAHPKSVEDEAGMGSAIHFGLGANWTTALTDSIALSVGLTYDHYSVSGADAKTYLNGSYYMDLYNTILNSDKWGGNETAMLDPETGDPVAINIKDLEASCPGWVCSTEGEIASIYKSMGIRVGINAKF